MKRFVDMAAAGWWSGELCVRTSFEGHPADLMRAEDLHVLPILTWTQCERLPPQRGFRRPRWTTSSFASIRTGITAFSGGLMDLARRRNPLLSFPRAGGPVRSRGGISGPNRLALETGCAARIGGGSI